MSSAPLLARLLRLRVPRGRPGDRSAHWLVAGLLALLLAQQVAVLHRLGHALLLLPDAGPLAVALADPGARLGGAELPHPADGRGLPGGESTTCLDCLALGDLGAVPPPAWQALPPPPLAQALPAWSPGLHAGHAPWRARARGPPVA